MARKSRIVGTEQNLGKLTEMRLVAALGNGVWTSDTA